MSLNYNLVNLKPERAYGFTLLVSIPYWQQLSKQRSALSSALCTTLSRGKYSDNMLAKWVDTVGYRHPQLCLQTMIARKSSLTTLCLHLFSYRMRCL